MVFLGSMDKWKIVLIVVVIIGAAALFYPKVVSHGCSGVCYPGGVLKTERSCFGLKIPDLTEIGCYDCASRELCFGQVYGKERCYTGRLDKEGYVELPECKSVETLAELIAICPDCYSEASYFAAREGRYEEALSYCSKLGEDVNCKSHAVRRAFENNFTQICDNVDIQTVECIKLMQNES